METSPSDPSNQRQKKGTPFKVLVPLIYAPVLPLIRIQLRHKPILRDRLFIGVLAGAFIHGVYLVYNQVNSFGSKDGIIGAVYAINACSSECKMQRF